MIQELLPWIRWVHLLAAATWTGGLITLAALVPALRRAGADRELLRAAARQFGRLSWVALVLAVVTGVAQVDLLGLSWSYDHLQWKIGLVALAAALALGHTLTARRSTAAQRGVVQLLIVLVSLAIFRVAIAL